MMALFRLKPLKFCARYAPVCMIAVALGTARAADTSPLLAVWIAEQTNIHSWSADVTQTRTFKTLSQPLVTHGRIRFVAPNFFRWELGEPALTIAVRQPEQMLVLYPRLKRAERYPLDAAAGPWRELLMLLDAGFPRSQAELDARFKVLSVVQVGKLGEVRLQPKSAVARRMMPEIKIVLGMKDSQVRATEMTFTDGSTMRNDFTKQVVNPVLDSTLFNFAIPDDFKVSEPLRSAPK